MPRPALPFRRRTAPAPPSLPGPRRPAPSASRLRPSPVAAAAIVALALAGPALGAGAPEAVADGVVRLREEQVLTLRAARAGETAAVRARRASEALSRAFDESPRATATVQVQGDTAAIQVGRVTVLELGPEDVAAEGAVGLEALANSHASRLDRALGSERRRASIASWVFDLSMLVFSGLVVFLLLGKLGDLDRRIGTWLRARPGHVPAVSLHGVELVSGDALGRALAVAVRIGRYLLALAVAYGWVVFALSLFPLTRGAGLRLGGVVLTPAGNILARFGGALPVAVGAVLAGALLWLLLRAVRLFFGSVARGETHVAWIPPDLAVPMGGLVRLGLVVVAAVFAAPLLTGTDQGTLAQVGTAALLAVALAAAPALANVAAGLPRLLRRTYRPGEAAELGRSRGVVRSVDLLHVELEDAEGARLLVPHLVGLVAPTRLAGGRGRVRFDLAVEPAQDLARVGALVRRAGGAGTSADLVRLDLAGAVFRVAGTDPDLAEKVSSALRAEGIPLGRAAPPSLPGTP